MAKEITLKEVGEQLAYIVANMATKGDLAELQTELKGDISRVRVELKGDIASLSQQIAGIERDIRQLRRDLNELSDKVENIAGYRKEIDHAFERIASIEKHLSIYKKAA